MITIGKKNAVTPEELANIETQAKQLIPWRKGPFCLFGMTIDAEWRSDLKFDRIKNHLGSLVDKSVLDIGCNNGYFMFRLLPYQPKLILGIDPVARCHQQFDFIQQYIQAPNLQYLPWGIADLPKLEQRFDVILSMGIIYHHRHPLQQLTNIYNALQPGGQLILETLGIPGETSTALFPEIRYAKMRNVWFVPTLNCCINWLTRTKFIDIKVLDTIKLTPTEQRVTPWSSEQSLVDFLHPTNSNKTIEGYPAPMRFCLQAYRA